LEQGMPIPVVITAYGDRTFSFITKTPPASFLIRKAAGLVKGAKTPSKEIVGKITIAQAREIAETKMPDLNAVDMDGAVMMIKGSARSMGVEVVG
jgi:large subunit ribosomal protein L11